MNRVGKGRDGNQCTSHVLNAPRCCPFAGQLSAAQVVVSRRTWVSSRSTMVVISSIGKCKQSTCERIPFRLYTIYVTVDHGCARVHVVVDCRKRCGRPNISVVGICDWSVVQSLSLSHCTIRRAVGVASSRTPAGNDSARRHATCKYHDAPSNGARIYRPRFNVAHTMRRGQKTWPRFPNTDTAVEYSLIHLLIQERKYPRSSLKASTVDPIGMHPYSASC